MRSISCRDGADHTKRWEGARTVAAGIRVPKAIGDFMILRAVRESGGCALAVDDAAAQDGLLLCPEGGATLAAHRKACAHGLVGAEDQVVLFNCAAGSNTRCPRSRPRSTATR